MIKKIIPSTLIGRSIIIIFVPIIIIVLLTSLYFTKHHGVLFLKD